MQDASAISLSPGPHASFKGAASELMAAEIFLCQLSLDHILRRDSGVVGTRYPERIVALHAPRAHQHILQRHIQRVPQMQLSGYIGRRNDDRKCFSRPCRIGGEITQVDPALIPALLGGLRFECFAEFQRSSVSLSKFSYLNRTTQLPA